MISRAFDLIQVLCVRFVLDYYSVFGNALAVITAADRITEKPVPYF